MAVGACLLLFVAPWVLGTLAIGRIPSRRATAGAWSLAANSAALILVCLVLRNTGGIGRGSLLAGWTAWSGAMLLAAWKPVSTPGQIGTLCRRWGPGMAIGLAAILLATALFHREHFVQCFNGDGTWACELARSLRGHFLPYWEIEPAGSFGTVIGTPALVNPYWTFALQLLLGEGEVASRLPFALWWLGIFAVVLSIVRPGDTRAKWLGAVPLALGLFLWTLWYTFYTGYYPYMSDLAEQGVGDALFTLLLLLALDCLRQKDLAGWVVLTALSSLVLYAGPVMFVLTGASALVWQPVPRERAIKALIAGTVAAAGITLFYVVWGWQEGCLAEWPSTLRMEYVEEYFAPVPRWRSGLLFAGYFLLGCGAIPAVALIRAFRSKRTDPDAAWNRTVATVVIAYLLIIMGAGYKNLHYLVPLLPMLLILWLKLPRRPSHREDAPMPFPVAGRAVTGWAAALAASGGLAVSVFLCWPTSRPVFTLNRDLGAITTFQTDSYEEACDWARISTELYDADLIGWFIIRHTWVQYSELEANPVQPRSLLVTDQTAPSPQYELLLESAEGVKLYRRDPEKIRWAARQHPPAGPDRCPWVFRPIAIAPPARSTD